MRILFDIFPVLLFFIVFKLSEKFPEAAQAFVSLVGYQAEPAQLPVLLSTATAILATSAQVGWVKWRHGKVDTALWVSLVIIMIFGGATLWLHNPNFIKWKPTVLYWFFSMAILFSRAFLDKNLIRLLLQTKMDLPDRTWQNLNLTWSAFFFTLGCLNLYIAFHFSMDVWVDFKLFGTASLMFLFIVAQVLFLSKHLKDESKSKP